MLVADVQNVRVAGYAIMKFNSVIRRSVQIWPASNQKGFRISPCRRLKRSMPAMNVALDRGRGR